MAAREAHACTLINACCQPKQSATFHFRGNRMAQELLQAPLLFPVKIQGLGFRGGGGPAVLLESLGTSQYITGRERHNSVSCFAKGVPTGFDNDIHRSHALRPRTEEVDSLDDSWAYVNRSACLSIESVRSEPPLLPTGLQELEDCSPGVSICWGGSHIFSHFM